MFDAALQAYERAIGVDASFVDATSIWDAFCTKPGISRMPRRLSRGDQGVRQRPLLLYNLGVLLDDMDRGADAVAAYEAALAR